MLTRKKIEKLWGFAYSEHKNEGGYDALVMFARLVGAAELERAAQRFNRGYLDTLRVVGELKKEASAARRAAKEGR